MPKEEYYIAMMRKPWQDFVKPFKLPILTERIKITSACGDCDDLPRVEDAGAYFVDETGHAVQLMHNGLKVLYGRYYGAWLNEIIRLLRGVHEPQEEWVFHQVLKHIPPGSVILEAGCYWGYYSMWFAKAVPDAQIYLVEPQPNQMKVALKNFELNGLTADHTYAYFGSYPKQKLDIQTRRLGDLPRLSIEDFMAVKGLERITMLHADIQGHEEEMLEEAQVLLAERKVDWLFISTHGARHQGTKAILQDAGYRLIAEHDVGQSASVDGLLAAQNPDLPEIPPIKTSTVKGLVQAHDRLEVA